jgi:magnesium chelatase subunit D
MNPTAATQASQAPHQVALASLRAASTAQACQAWQDAQFALMALQVEPLRLGGIWLRAGHGPVRDVWLRLLQASGLKTIKIPNRVDDERLLGGIDLAQTLQHSTLVQQPGLLAQADGATVLLPMAERLPAQTLAHIAQAQDRGCVHARDGQHIHPARFGIIALDEAEADEAGIAPRLSDRLGIWLDLHAHSLADTQDRLEPLGAHEQAEAQALLQHSAPSAAQVQALCHTAQALGVDSLRAPLLALRLACVRAALQGREAPDDDDLATAARLVLCPRATRLPATPPPDAQTVESEPEPPPPDDAAEPPESSTADPDQAPAPLEDLLLAAAVASLPPHLLDRLLLGQPSRHSAQSLGSSGQASKSKLRGRPLSPRPGQPGAGARLHLLATLRAAAPKQRLRTSAPGTGRVRIRSEDFHVRRFAQRTPSCLIFSLDASGSAAQQRLAEAKGAVELLLQDSYARRDSVCVIAFRMAQAQVLLAPTRSLVRAKRALAGLPGGGGTPLASGIQAAVLQARTLQRAGSTPLLVMLSDGRANVSAAGIGGRSQAQADAQAWARQWRLCGWAALWIDTAAQPEPQAQQLAALMGAHYFPMPYVQAQRMANVVQDLAGQLRTS